MDMTTSILASKEFWISAAERAIRTFAQTFVATVTVSIGMNTEAWGAALLSSLIAGILSLATSVAVSGVGKNGPGVTESVNIPKEPGVGETPADEPSADEAAEQSNEDLGS